MLERGDGLAHRNECGRELAGVLDVASRAAFHDEKRPLEKLLVVGRYHWPPASDACAGATVGSCWTTASTARIARISAVIFACDI